MADSLINRVSPIVAVVFTEAMVREIQSRLPAAKLEDFILFHRYIDLAWIIEENNIWMKVGYSPSFLVTEAKKKQDALIKDIAYQLHTNPAFECTVDSAEQWLKEIPAQVRESVMGNFKEALNKAVDADRAAGI